MRRVPYDDMYVYYCCDCAFNRRKSRKAKERCPCKCHSRNRIPKRKGGGR